ncbi:MAG: hypothetical protein KKB59_19960, partial [Spirochaetes bacterium]|nr:hypothetical protein [Spirochaetota bacterium]
MIRLARRINYRFGDFLFDLRSRCYAFKHGHRYEANWNADLWFIENIIPIIESQIEHGITTPYNIEFQDWKNILRKMVYGFKFYRDVENMVGYRECFKECGVEQFCGMWRKSMTDEEKELYDKANKKWWDTEDRA